MVFKVQINGMQSGKANSMQSRKKQLKYYKPHDTRLPYY